MDERAQTCITNAGISKKCNDFEKKKRGFLWSIVLNMSQVYILQLKWTKFKKLKNVGIETGIFQVADFKYYFIRFSILSRCEPICSFRVKNWDFKSLSPFRAGETDEILENNDATNLHSDTLSETQSRFCKHFLRR